MIKKNLTNLFQCLFLSHKSHFPKKLDSLDIQGVANYLKKCKNVICMVGAGVSTSAGIPDFRSKNTGLYSRLKELDLPYPEAVFDIDFFKKNSKPFFTVAKTIFPINFKPTITHYFMRLLHEKGHLLRIYSQNIDMLEHLARIPQEIIVNAHGSFKSGHCIKCYQKYSFDWMKEELFNKEFLKCTKCENGVVKPDIVFFGELLPQEFFDNVENDFNKCDLLLIFGTSLKVEPFSSLTTMVPFDCPRLLINDRPVGDDLLYDKEHKNYRDVFYKGSCDDGCMKIAKLLNYEKLLIELYNNDSK